MKYGQSFISIVISISNVTGYLYKDRTYMKNTPLTT